MALVASREGASTTAAANDVSASRCRHPQERRLTSLVGTLTTSADLGSPRISPRTSSAARRPASASGYRMVASGGTFADAPGWSSKPMTATSSGTRRPRSARARMAPIAETSLLARTALNGLPVERIACIATRPPSSV